MSSPSLKPGKLPSKQCKTRVNELKTFCNSGVKFIEQFNFDFCASRYREFKTQKSALLSKKINLREVAATYNTKTPEALLSLWLTNLCIYMDFSIMQVQISPTAKYMVEEIGMLNMAELTLLFHRIREGFYGEFYGKFNPQIVLRACREYRQERGRIISKMNSEEQSKILNTLYEYE